MYICLKCTQFLKINAGNSLSDGNSSMPPEEFCEIVFIASMMSSLVILMSDSVFICGCPKKSFGYLIVIVGSGVLKTLLYCSFSSSLIFLLLCSRFPSTCWRGPIPALIAELILKFVEVFCVFFYSSNSSRFS